MMGREIMAQLELIAGRPPGELGEEVAEYGAELRARLEKVYTAVRERTGREMERQKTCATVER